MGTIKTTNIETITGSGTLTLGQSGETITIPSGVTVSGAATNTPAFEAFLSASASINHDTITKVQCNTEVFDTDNCYDNSTNYRFTPTVAGKYFVYSKARIDTTASNCEIVVTYIYKNGSLYAYSLVDFDANDGEGASVNNYATIDMNGSSDYVELFGFGKTASGSGTLSVEGDSSSHPTLFGAYKLIGV